MLEDKISVIDYCMELVKIDLASSHKLDSVYKVNEADDLFPDRFKVKLWQYEKLLDFNGDKVTRKLDEKTYISTRKTDRLLRAFLSIVNKGFKEDKNNHWSYYYPEIDLLHVYNGKHSSVVGTVIGGEIEAIVVSIEKLVENGVVTDGAYWYCPVSAEVDKRIGIVSDFRIALLYELYVLKLNYQSQK